MLSALDVELRDGVESFLRQDLRKELLRFTTAGSVDDGKSTLIGRLLHDSKAVYEDQLASVQKSRINRAAGPIDFSLLTDGLRAEREQGITIDVAYRYFRTSRRKFIIADTPGHEQYTRNMATGASTADLAVILVDATKGLLSQTRRHAYIASLLGIGNVVAAINKMDLVAYREDVFLRLEEEFVALAEGLEIPLVRCIPISALEGDNIVTRSERTPWFTGPALLEHLETVPLGTARKSEALRFPVQSVIRPDAAFRGFAGRVAGGVVHPGDTVLALPSGRPTKVQAIVTYDGEREVADASESVVLRLKDEIDLSRGDMLVSPEAPPFVSHHFAAMVVWLHAQPLDLKATYLVKHAGRVVKAFAARIQWRVDVNTLTDHPATQLKMNEIASVEFQTSSPLFFDPYQINRTTGSFILIDPISNATVGAGMIREDLSEQVVKIDQAASLRVSARTGITSAERYRHHRHRSAIFAVAGDRSFAELLERALFDSGFEAVLVNGESEPSASFRGLLSTLWEMGAVIVYFDDARASKSESFLKAIAGEFLFDAFPEKPFGAQREMLRRTLALAETLRIQDAASKQEEN